MISGGFLKSGILESLGFRLLSDSRNPRELRRRDPIRGSCRSMTCMHPITRYPYLDPKKTYLLGFLNVVCARVKCHVV